MSTRTGNSTEERVLRNSGEINLEKISDGIGKSKL